MSMHSVARGLHYQCDTKCVVESLVRLCLCNGLGILVLMGAFFEDLLSDQLLRGVTVTPAFEPAANLWIRRTGPVRISG
jgi:hypothetical protein